MINVSEKIKHTGIGVLDKDSIVANQAERESLTPELFQECRQADNGERYIYLQNGWFRQGTTVQINGSTLARDEFQGVPLGLIVLMSNTGDLKTLSGTSKETASNTIDFGREIIKQAYLYIL